MNTEPNRLRDPRIDCEHSGIVDLARLGEGASTPTARPLGGPSRRTRGRTGGRSPAAVVTLVATLVASSAVLAATLTGGGPLADRARDERIEAARADGRAAGASTPRRVEPAGERAATVPVPEGPDPADAPAPGSDEPEPVTDVSEPQTAVRPSATSAPSPRHTAPQPARRAPSTPETEPAAPAPRPQDDEESELDQDLDRLLERALQDDRPAAEPAQPDLPARPSRGEVAQAMRTLQSRVQSCAEGASGIVEVSASLDGPTGRARSVTVAGGALDGGARACIEGAVKGAQFPRFAGTGFEVSFPYVL